MSNEFTPENSPEWEALTQADPASDRYIDLGKVRAQVTTDVAPQSNVVPLLRRSWIKPAAAAAVVALVTGTGTGYSIAAFSIKSDTSMPAVYTDGATAGMTPEIASDAKLGGVGMNDQAMTTAGSGKMSSSYWGGFGARAYLEPASAISDNSGTAVGYLVDDADVNRKTAIKDLAQAFGVKGKATGSAKEGLTIGDTDWTGPVVQINGSEYDKNASWNFNDNSVAPQMCNENKVGIMSPNGQCDEVTGDAITADEAIALTQKLFATLGLAASDAQWSTYDATLNWGVKPTAENVTSFHTVIADLLVDGQTSGMQWNLTVGPDSKISSATGFFAKFVATAAYDIVGAKTAALRSQDARWMNLGPQEQFHNGGYPMPLAYAKDVAVSSDVRVSTGITEPKITFDADGRPKLDANLDKQSVTSATSGYLQWWLVDGTTILLPAYKLVANQGTDSVDDDRTWVQMSIADKYIDFS